MSDCFYTPVTTTLVWEMWVRLKLWLQLLFIQSGTTPICPLTFSSLGRLHVTYTYLNPSSQSG